MSKIHGCRRDRHLASVVAFLALWLPGPAFADHCHVSPPLEALGLGFHVAGALEFASYDTARGEGEYLGASLGASYDTHWLRVRALLPAYLLTRDEAHFRGLGDLALEAKLAVLTSADDTFQSGIVLLATAPTGDASADLGMGHFMLMPGLWGELLGERAFIQAQLSYARALASEDSHEGHERHTTAGPGPIVNPMNTSEISAAASIGYAINELIRLRAGVSGAIPVGVEDGASRAVAILGVDFLLDPFDLGLEGQLPFLGDPFTAKAVLTGGLRF